MSPSTSSSDWHGAVVSVSHPGCLPHICPISGRRGAGAGEDCESKGELTWGAAEPGGVHPLPWIWSLYRGWSHLPKTQSPEPGEEEGKMVVDVCEVGHLSQIAGICRHSLHPQLKLKDYKKRLSQGESLNQDQMVRILCNNTDTEDFLMLSAYTYFDRQRWRSTKRWSTTWGSQESFTKPWMV